MNVPRKQVAVPRAELKRACAFADHGVEFQRLSGEHAIGECPFDECGKSKFHVNVKTGQWDCKSCGESGNVPTFLAAVLEWSQTSDFDALAEDRQLPPEAFADWHVGFNELNDTWVVPVYTQNASECPVDLRRYAMQQLMRHGDIATTMAHYVKANPEAARAAMAQMRATELPLPLDNYDGDVTVWPLAFCCPVSGFGLGPQHVRDVGPL